MATQQHRNQTSPFIFVGGCQRSGTSLLQGMLCSDETSNPRITEAEYLRQLVETYSKAKQSFDYSLIDYFDDADAFRRFHSAWITTFLERTLRRYPPASRLVLKEPHLTRYFPDLWELIPQARFVVLVRDPRDTLLSMLEVGKRLAAKGSNHFLARAELKSLIPHYLSFYRPCLQKRDQRFRRNLMFIKYEDLVTSPATVLESLRSFTGLALNHVDLADPWKRALRPIDAPHERQKPWRTSLYGKGVVATSVGRYRRDLSPQEVRVIDEGLRSFYPLFGYKPDSASQ